MLGEEVRCEYFIFSNIVLGDLKPHISWVGWNCNIALRWILSEEAGGKYYPQVQSSQIADIFR